jgi:holliday junction DNA helicase RuvA
VIAYLSGALVRKETDRVIVDVNGVGYEAFVSIFSLSSLPAAGETVGLHTYLHVREDALLLFGFASEDEKDLFLRLIALSGVGPKLALSILSVFSPAEFQRVLISGDVKALTTIPGIGQKGAKRLVLELQEKLIPADAAGLPADAAPGTQTVYAEAREALLGLGYNAAEANRALEGYPADGDVTVEAIIKYALKNLASV